MALFKISYGPSANLSNQKKTEGYCWFTPDDGKFYIDHKDNNGNVVRTPLNAVLFSSNNPAALGTSASPGSSGMAARSDHIHALPALTSCTGTLTTAKGGTGNTSYTAGQLLYASTTTKLSSTTNAAISNNGSQITLSGTGTSTDSTGNTYAQFKVTRNGYNARLQASVNVGIYGSVRTSENWLIMANHSADSGRVNLPDWATTGSSTQPVYFDSKGKPVACSLTAASVGALSTSVAIAANTDLNSIQTEGLYHCSANATVATLTNSPTTYAFTLFVGKHAGVYQRLIEYTPYGSAKTYIRNCYNGTWSDWGREYTTWDKPVVGDVSGAAAAADYLNITGAGTNIAKNTDLNTLVTPGHYSCVNDNNSGLSNCPVSSGGFKLITIRGYSTNYFSQFIMVGASNKYYYRSRNSSNTWTAWVDLTHSHSYLALSGGTLTGDVTISKSTTIANNTPISLNFKMTQTDNNVSSTSYIRVYDDLDAAGNGNNMVIASMSGTYLCAGEGAASYLTNNASTAECVHICADSKIYFHANCNTVANSTSTCYIDTTGVLYGAAWNDYAEFRATTDMIEAGRVVVENGNDTLSLATERLQPGANIVSDTFGFAIGETDTSKTPLAVSGRVLAYTYEDRNEFKAGDPVCSGPNGTVSKMTREEVMMYPDRMIGTVSAIPSYETWSSGNVQVNGRIWIKI